MLYIKRIILSISVALLTAFVISTIALAATGYVSETAGYPYFWGWGPLHSHTCSNCANGSAYRVQQYSWEDTAYDYWYPGVGGIKEWCAYTPGVGVAGVRYYMDTNGTEHYSVVLNQANRQNTYRYLGNFTNTSNTGGQLSLLNSCVTGYACDGRYVYWDKIKYTTFPTLSNCGP